MSSIPFFLPKDFPAYDPSTTAKDLPPLPDLNSDVRLSYFKVGKIRKKYPEVKRLKCKLLEQSPQTVEMGNISLRNSVIIMKNHDNPEVPYMPTRWTHSIIQQYHDRNGQLGEDKVVPDIHHWHRMPIEVAEYIDKRLACKTRNLKTHIQNSCAKLL